VPFYKTLIIINLDFGTQFVLFDPYSTLIHSSFKIFTLKQFDGHQLVKKVFSFFRLTGYFYKKAKYAPSVKRGAFSFLSNYWEVLRTSGAISPHLSNEGRFRLWPVLVGASLSYQ